MVPMLPEPPDDLPEGAPPELQAAEMVIGGERFVVLSYPIEGAAIDPDGVLTAAEAAVAALAAQGLSNRGIAARRCTSVRTVANQMAAILRKLGCGSRRELAVRAVRGALGDCDDIQ